METSNFCCTNYSRYNSSLFFFQIKKCWNMLNVGLNFYKQCKVPIWEIPKILGTSQSIKGTEMIHVLISK